ncbi:DUF3515 domain-containing protein [Rhodococcus sp. NPDC019627]|uniref:DUF3515 domain-containing protein n=1 Tax=unclassified Rhodococcus (in: high G+C Gram-positive bacteria) TaxID=192944 RepID=UPI0033E25C4F
MPEHESHPTDAATDTEPVERRNPALIATAVALPVALVIGIVVAAVIAGRNPAKSPVSLGPVPAPAAASAECTALMAGLPDALGEYTRAELTPPAPAATAAWQPAEGEPLVLRCGLDRPAEFDQASSLQVINGVQWFEISGESAGIDASSWFAVDRGIYVGLTVPRGVGPTPLQEMSDAVSKVLPQKPLDPAPVPNP